MRDRPGALQGSPLVLSKLAGRGDPLDFAATSPGFLTFFLESVESGENGVVVFQKERSFLKIEHSSYYTCNNRANYKIACMPFNTKQVASKSGLGVVTAPGWELTVAGV